MPTDDDPVDHLSAPCPSCKAEPGAPCTLPYGGRPMLRPHARRRHLAEARAHAKATAERHSRQRRLARRRYR